MSAGEAENRRSKEKMTVGSDFTWADATQLSEAPPSGEEPDSLLIINGSRYWEIGLSGWDAMLGWFCGPSSIVKYPEDRRFNVVVLEETNEGVSQREEPRTIEDQENIDESLNSFLRDFGLPEPPTGFRWFQQLPEGVTVEQIQLAAAGIMEQRNELNQSSVEAIKDAIEELCRRPR
jgi:hypothetical protein